MNRKAVVLLVFLTVLCMLPSNLSASYDAPAIADEPKLTKDFIPAATAIDFKLKQDETNTTSALTGYKCKLSLVFTPATAGNYLIVVMATGKTSSTSGACYIRLYVAGTGYSEGIIYVANAYQYMTFCAIKQLSLSGSTNISICFRSSSTSYTASVWDARIFATNATIEQYAQAETRTTDAVASSWTNKSSITITPADTGDYWILADGIFDGSSGTYSTLYRVITKNGTVMVDCLREMQNAAARFSLGFSRIIHLSAGVSNNIVVQFDTENSGNTAGSNWVHIAALRIDQFANSYYAESASEYTPVGAGSWYDTVTKTYTPAAAGHLIIGCINEKTGSTTASSGYVQTRLNLGSGTDLKDADKWLSKDTSDYMSFFKFYNRTMAASSRTDSLQYLGGSTSARVKTPRLLIIELAAASEPTPPEEVEISQVLSMSETPTTAESLSLVITEVLEASATPSLAMALLISFVQIIGVAAAVSTQTAAVIMTFQAVSIASVSSTAISMTTTLSELLSLTSSAAANILTGGLYSILVDEVIGISSSMSSVFSAVVGIAENLALFDMAEALINPPIILMLYALLPIGLSGIPTGGLEGMNIFYDLFFSANMWSYLGPMGLVVIGYLLMKKDKILGVFWFIVECLFVAQYVTLVGANPDYWWHILILLLGGLFTCVYPLWDR